MERNEADEKTILIVEDEPGIAKVCVRTLTGEGFLVDVAVDGVDALAMWRKKDYCLCISDIMTPRMNGIELYKQLEKEYPDAINKFIFTTCNLLIAEVRAFIEKAGKPCLSKPFSPDNLRDMVKTFMVLV
jgi:CheY-like chemotaxis protein